MIEEKDIRIQRFRNMVGIDSTNIGKTIYIAEPMVSNLIKVLSEVREDIRNTSYSNSTFEPKKIEGEYADSPLHDFRQQLYLMYLEREEGWKEVSKEDFFDKVGSLDISAKTKHFNKDDVHRAADSKTVWTTKGNKVIGESWKENNLTIYYIKA